MPNIQPLTLPPWLEAFAAGDFALLASRFVQAGHAVESLAPGMLQVTATRQPAPRVLLSVGIHGDETGPIELLAQVLQQLSAAPGMLATNLLVVLGNPDAVAAGKRFIDVDLNRLFREQIQTAPSNAEAARAAAIMQIAKTFFAHDACGWHLDLHSTIRPSRHERFAIIPVTANSPSDALLAWLDTAAIEAAILSHQPGSTFSSFTARHCHCTSATLELGRVAPLGSNDGGRFTSVSDALLALLSSELPETTGKPHPGLLYEVTHEIVRQSASFVFALADDELHTFCPVPPHTLVASDGDYVYHTGPDTEYLVFPNPEVGFGLRAGILVRRRESSQL